MHDLRARGLTAFAIVFGVSLFSGCASRSTPPAPMATEGDRVAEIVADAIRPLLHESPIATVSIGVVKGGQSHLFTFIGASHGNGGRTPSNPLFGIGSLTKTFTATLVAQATLEGKLDLDDDVRKYLDGEYPNLEVDGSPIRIVHLLNHVSGLPNFLFDLPPSAPEDSVRALQSSYSREDFYRDLHRITLLDKPGERFRYSNSGAQLMGYILERVYRMPYEEIVRSKISEPLGMNATKITLSPAEARSYRGYDGDGSVAPANPDQTQAAGALKSTMSDMLKYAAWHLAEEDEAVALTHRPRLNLVDDYWLGLNWQIFLLPTYRVVWQQGSLPGFMSYCVLYPELDLAIVALANEFDPATSDRLTAVVKDITRAIDPRAAGLP